MSGRSYTMKQWENKNERQRVGNFTKRNIFPKIRVTNRSGLEDTHSQFEEADGVRLWRRNVARALEIFTGNRR